MGGGAQYELKKKIDGRAMLPFCARVYTKSSANSLDRVNAAEPRGAATNRSEKAHSEDAHPAVLQQHK